MSLKEQEQKIIALEKENQALHRKNSRAREAFGNR